MLSSKLFNSIKDKFPEFLDDLTNNLKKTAKENEIKKIDIEIKSCKSEPKGFSIEIFGFPPEYYPNMENFKEDEIVLSICIEGQNSGSLVCLANMVSKIKETFIADWFHFTEKYESNTLYLDWILKIRHIEKIKKAKDFLKFNINFNEFEKIDLKLKTNFKFDNLSSENIYDLILEAFSFVLSIKGETKNLHYLLLSLLATSEKYIKEWQYKRLKRYIEFIMAFESMNFNFNFNPENIKNAYLVDEPMDNQQAIKTIKETLLTWLGLFLLIFGDLDTILNNVKFDHFLISCLIAKFKTGFILDINSPGLTKLLQSDLKTTMESTKEKCNII